MYDSEYEEEMRKRAIMAVRFTLSRHMSKLIPQEVLPDEVM
jgi:hypothetical protein